ncbi:nuclear transport factor 2 family protein [Aurantiacibacter flavus]|uniref:Nuclear transport factor 2 family protein n=1 Tax=Aurantiacibacter flavus TaxID=3145232 RepID=A0ABV0CZI5_9SPHN
MTREDFESYIAAFNANDFEGFSKFYADDVDFTLGGRKHIVGRQGIVDFYRGVKDHIREELTILDLLVAPEGFCMHNRTVFTTIKDWPDFELWPTKAGDVREIESIILYRTQGDRFVSIKSARFK